MSEQPVPELTREETARKLDQVLVEVNGDRKLAADVMELTPSQVSALINKTPALRVKWSEAERQIPETIPDQIDRKPIAKSLIRAERNAEALVKQEQGLSKGLTKMGFSSREVEAIQTVEDFAGKYFDQTLTILHGGLVKSSIKLMMLAEHIEDTYLDDPNLEPKDRNMWWNTYFRILENLRAQNDQAYKAALTRAMINTKKGEGSGGRPSGKPGFSSLTAIQVNVGDKKDA